MCSVIIDKGYNPPLVVWDKLLQYSLETDTVVYVRIAHNKNVFLHNVESVNKFSLHMAVK